MAACFPDGMQFSLLFDKESAYARTPHTVQSLCTTTHNTGPWTTTKPPRPFGFLN